MDDGKREMDLKEEDLDIKTEIEIKEEIDERNTYEEEICEDHFSHKWQSEEVKDELIEDITVKEEASDFSYCKQNIKNDQIKDELMKNIATTENTINFIDCGPSIKSDQLKDKLIEDIAATKDAKNINNCGCTIKRSKASCQKGSPEFLGESASDFEDQGERPNAPISDKVLLRRIKCSKYPMIRLKKLEINQHEMKCVGSPSKQRKMAGKHPASGSISIGNPPKKLRKTLMLDIKIDVLNRFDKGERAVDIGKALGIAPTTIRTIRDNAKSVRKSAESVASCDAPYVSRHRSEIMEKMEGLLGFWVEDMRLHDSPITLGVVKEKALSLFEDLKKEHGGSSQEEKFTASRGWFERFKKRKLGAFTIKIGKQTSADKETAERYALYLKQIIQEDGYMPEQVFNVNETRLYWKRMPERTYVTREEKSAPGFKASKDRVTLLLGGNAAGDLKLKPLLIYHSQNLRALKGYSELHLPVIWHSNKKAWVTQSIFSEWYTMHFCPAVKEYCDKKELPHKVLLLLDNTSGHPISLEELSENVKVIFLPPNTTSLLQPMDQQVISTFKAYYMRRTFRKLIQALDRDNRITVREFWKSYGIMDAIENINESWEEVSSVMMDSCWRHVWPECVREFSGFQPGVQDIRRDIVRLAHSVGFDEIVEKDIVELLALHADPLSNEDLLLLDEQRAEEETKAKNNKPEAEPTKTLTTKLLAETFQSLNKIVSVYTENDPDRERSHEVSRHLQAAVECYKEMYHQKNKAAVEQTLDVFFKRKDEKHDQEKKDNHHNEEKDPNHDDD